MYLSSCNHTISFFFFNDTATTEIYTLSLHDALPISGDATRRTMTRPAHTSSNAAAIRLPRQRRHAHTTVRITRSEEHTSELQSRQYLVCRLLLEKKKKNITANIYQIYNHKQHILSYD